MKLPLEAIETVRTCCWHMFCEGLWTRVAVLRGQAHSVLVDVFLHLIAAMLICKQLEVLTLESLTLGRVALLGRERKSWVENS